MSEEKTRTDAWESCLTEEQRLLLNAWSRTASYDVVDVLLGKIHVCANPNCRKVFKQVRKGQMYCTKACGHSANSKEYSLRYRTAHRQECLALGHFMRLERKERLESDPQEYARVRELKRLSNRRCWERHHPNCKPYTPRPWLRIPDWAVMGQDVIDHGSVFLAGNMSDDQIYAGNAYALELRPDAGANRPRVKTIFRSR